MTRLAVGSRHVVCAASGAVLSMQIPVLLAPAEPGNLTEGTGLSSQLGFIFWLSGLRETYVALPFSSE